ncbi:mucin-2-like isoform X2 [Stegostoma tigrinum]|uniref:mucin-2-like isoform X2 n=1 Tax=Stegostoma tigrinum TaxID=3053191 RepID=UPI0028707089|nr:mucin-2-like isoform X2 [Stegostoma tigrinum]
MGASHSDDNFSASTSAMKYSSLLTILVLMQIKGSCYTWGRGAFRTFQDDFFYFTSKCNFILSRQCKGPAEDFNIQIRRGANGNLVHIHMLIEGVSVITENETVRVKDFTIKLPYDDKIIAIQKYGIYTRISNRKHTISVIWNHRDSLSITLDTKYKSQTCGLCGNFQEGTGTNTDSDNAVYNIMVANQLDVLGQVCVNDQPSSSRCSAANSCIYPISMYFSTCFANPTFANKYLKLCQKDVCACGNKEECACATFEELSRQCTNLPVTSNDEDYIYGIDWKEWRSKVRCVSPDCPENQFYQECGAACVPTCSDPETQQQCDQCVNTCECPEDTVLDDVRDTGKCIYKTACPCEYGGLIYNSGQIRNMSCHSCVCQSGMWECLDISCPGRCKIEEGTHFTTFDNKYYTLNGDCLYYAVVTKAWTVKVELRPCQIAFKQTCLQHVVLTHNQTSYTFSNDGNVYSEGNKVGLPLAKGDVIIFQQSSMFIQVAIGSGMKMQIQISPIMQLYISLPEAAQGSTKGLCGTFNDNANDDFLSAHNIVEDAPLTFANSWEAESHCTGTLIFDPCISSDNEHYAKLHCSYLKGPMDAFAVCHSTVDYMKYYQMCVAATCACENINDCLCAGLGAYVHECAAHGVIIRNWRKDICNNSCSYSQVFENDMRACNRTCRSLSETDYTCSVQDVPVYGCGCPKGKYMDESGVCVDSSDCPCYAAGLLLEKGQSINLHGRSCVCQDGRLHCSPVTTTSRPPDCPHGKVIINCKNEGAPSTEYSCERTCRTLNTPCSPCVPGCFCPPGLVEDNDGNCIRHENCPCLFHGEFYRNGREIQRDCNKCICQGGTWNCTDKECPKTCEVYGDGHYVTFDGRRYVYEGNCEYIFVEDQCNRRKGTFQILIESVPCCERGMTCSRNIRILFEGKELILTDNHVETIEKFTSQTQCPNEFYSRHTVGLYLILKFSHGITVIWDKSTRFSITLDSRWKNNVCGLCGNFNDDVSDDLTTKGNSLVTSAVEFGNSWKSMTCSDTVNQTSPCDRNPYCLAWAQRKCGIIKNVVFQACHGKVDPTPFYDACVQEACACDLEGKYLGFCTAVAVYAEACNKAGVCVDWRTPERCPVYCDYYNTPGECSWHYQPCGTLTTKTCSEHSIGKKYSAILEGCYANCPENAPYLDENKMKCVNMSDCTCHYNGKILEPGEQSNDCSSCTCMNGKISCTEICEGEWSLWFNENTPTLQNRADTELLNQMSSPPCPFSPHQITAIQCEALKFPQRPISEMKDYVTCEKETGLICTYNNQTSENSLMCLDYRIRVCCQHPTPSTRPNPHTLANTTTATVPSTPTSTSITVPSTPTSTSTAVPSTPTSTSTTVPSTPTSTSTAVPSTPTSTSTTVPSTPTSTAVPSTPTSTSTTVPSTPTSTSTAVPSTPTSTSTAVPSTPTSTSTAVPSTPTSTSTAVPSTPTSTSTAVPSTPTSTSTAVPSTPTSTSTTVPSTPTSTSTAVPSTPTSTSTTVPSTPTSTSTAVPSTPTSTSTAVPSTPTSTSTTVPSTPTSTSTAVPSTPTSTSTAVPSTPTTTSTAVPSTPTSTSTAVPSTPTSTSTAVPSTPTSTSTTVPSTPTSTSTAVPSTPTSTSTAVPSTPTSTSTTVPSTPTSTSTAVPSTPTSTSTAVPSTPTSTSTAVPSTPTSTSTAVPSTPTSTSTTVPSTPTSTSTTVPSTPTSTSTAVPSTPTSTSTAVPSTPRSTSTAVPSTPTSTSTAVPTTPTSTSTAVPSTPTSTSTAVPSTPTSTSTTVPSTPTSTSTSTAVPSTPTSTSTAVPSTPTFTSTAVPSTPTSISTAVPSTPTSTSTAVPSTPTSTSSAVPSTPTSTSTAVPSTPTSTSTAVPSTPTSTSTAVPSTPTSTTIPTTPTSTSTAVPSITSTVTNMTKLTRTTLSETTIHTTQCLPDQKPTCPKSAMFLDENGCEKWYCYCQCQVWGDPHYLTFGGTQYDFFDNCTYTLVEERVPKYNFSVLVDNYYCFEGLPMSCVRGIVMFYNESVVTVTTGSQHLITFDGDNVAAPYSLNGIDIYSKQQTVYISIPEIQAIIISFGDSFQIRLSHLYFLNNTQGQCGSCLDDVDDCLKRDREVMPKYCCHIAANDWKVPDPNKPYCQLTPTNLECPGPETPSPTCPPEKTVCELLLEKPFEDCRKLYSEEIDRYYHTCLFDHCHTNSTKFDCSSLQAAAIACNDRGVCVDWRNFTNGYCNYTCPGGFIYKACETQDNDQCENNTLIPGQKLYPLSESCFCPKGMILSENKTSCVTSCEVCIDNSGNPREEGERWSHPTNSCTIFMCLNSQVVITERPCCCKNESFWEEDYCSYWCRNETFGECKMSFTSKYIITENSSCSAEVTMTKCEGNCPGRFEFDTVTNSMINECSCCQPTNIQNMTVNLKCEDGGNIPYTYAYITACKCIGNTCNSPFSV